MQTIDTSQGDAEEAERMPVTEVTEQSQEVSVPVAEPTRPSLGSEDLHQEITGD